MFDNINGNIVFVVNMEMQMEIEMVVCGYLLMMVDIGWLINKVKQNDGIESCTKGVVR